jgi:hypothetical protein
VSIARFVAEAALAAAEAIPPPTARRRAPSRLAIAEIADAVTAVNRVGNNLNQLAREYNVTGVHPPATEVQVRRTLDALHRLGDIAEAAGDG